MIIDSTHRRWLGGTALAAVVAVALYIWFRQSSATELTGGSIAGLWYGIIGALLMVYAGLLAAHRKLLRWSRIPSRSWWLKGHIWLGLLSAVFILCHSGFRWGGVLEQVLWWLFILTLVSGIAGLGLQQFLPRLLAARIPQETPFEQIPHVCRVLRRQADDLVDSLCGPRDPSLAPLEKRERGDPRLAHEDQAKLRDFYERVVRPYLGERQPPSPLSHPAQAELAFAQLHALPGLFPVREQITQLEHVCAERRFLQYQERIHRWLHGWLLIHVPLSAALLVVGLAHALGSLYY
jgi:hypothetical protein